MKLHFIKVLVIAITAGTIGLLLCIAAIWMLGTAWESGKTLMGNTIMKITFNLAFFPVNTMRYFGITVYGAHAVIVSIITWTLIGFAIAFCLNWIYVRRGVDKSKK